MCRHNNISILMCAALMQASFGTELTADTDADNDWKAAENQFHSLDAQFKEVLKDKFGDFKAAVSEATQLHHSKFSCSRTDPTEECYGQASLTESELIFHQTLDNFATSIPSEDLLEQLHAAIHNAFKTTREILLTKALLQQSEFLPDAVIKQNQMIHKYKRTIVKNRY